MSNKAAGEISVYLMTWFSDIWTYSYQMEGETLSGAWCWLSHRCTLIAESHHTTDRLPPCHHEM